MHGMQGLIALVFGLQLVVGVIVVFVIKRVLLGDTMSAVTRLRQVEAEVRKKEDAIRRKIEEHEKEFQKQQAEAEEQLRKRREASDREVAGIRDKVLAEAKSEGEKLLAEAHRNKEKIREELVRDMSAKAVECASEVFQMVFSEKMNTVINKAFIDELLDALQEVDGTSITVDASDSQFTSSHPIDGVQKERIQKLLLDKFGVDIKVAEKVEPHLIAGLKLKLGSLEIDGSLLNRFREGFEEVKRSKGL